MAVLPDYAVAPRDRLQIRPIAGASVKELAVAWRRDLPLTRGAEELLAAVRAQAAERA